jgi:drug/metabolite transporter (DMT)-like permease
MRANPLLLTILCTALLAAGQLFFKAAAEQIRFTGRVPEMIWNALSDPYLLTGLAIYASATTLWIWVLRDAPLSIAYPITALAFVIVPLLSVAVFKEPFHVKYIYGGLLIVIGVFVIAR